MPIQTHTLETTQQANGSTHNVLRMYDQDGKQYMVTFFAPSGADLNAIAVEKIATTDVSLAEAEFQRLVEAG